MGGGLNCLNNLKYNLGPLPKYLFSISPPLDSSLQEKSMCMHSVCVVKVAINIAFRYH